MTEQRPAIVGPTGLLINATASPTLPGLVAAAGDRAQLRFLE